MKRKIRYTQIEFPPYRFIPGENPHPTENPQGHSFGKKELRLAAFDPAQWRENKQYLYGVDLYNHGYWWESHEAFEGLWRTAVRGDVSRDYLQALIKISGAFIKWHLKKRQGLGYLYQGAITHLSKVGKEYHYFMGINVPEHIKKVQNHFSTVINSQEEWPDPMDNYPAIILELME